MGISGVVAASPVAQLEAALSQQTWAVEARGGRLDPRLFSRASYIHVLPTAGFLVVVVGLAVARRGVVLRGGSWAWCRGVFVARPGGASRYAFAVVVEARLGLSRVIVCCYVL